MNVTPDPKQFTAKDFTTDQEVRWCPGCGDYAILKAVRATLADIGTAPENVVFVSGIGCAARFPYYISSYGFHTIHGRAPAVATGVKLQNPDLDVWVVGGDGDMLSIGGNHTMHALRRNVDLNILLFNNEIYGLTKGQYSPTSRVGTRSPSTPDGSVDRPLSAIEFSLGAGARFVARSIDTAQKHLPGVLKRAHAHKGASIVEIFQNCIVYNDGVFDHFAAKKTASETQLHVEHGKPLLFGKENEKGIRFNPKTFSLEVATVGEGGVELSDIVVHDETNKMLAQMLAAFQPPDFPVVIGVIYCDPGAEYVDGVTKQSEDAKESSTPADINALLRKGSTWTV